MLHQDVIKALINLGNTNIKPGLERMHQALALLSNPQHQYQTIHITGTNGKGSTAAFIESGLIHAGLRVGKFTSPYIWQINECIVINGVAIADSELERVFFILKPLLAEQQIEPSPFEFLTIIMFYFMAEQKVDYLVLEAGMGGTNDCTNVVDSIFSIITNVSLEHTQWLGDTLSEIATEKAGIIKNGKTIIADSGDELLAAVEARTNNYVNVLDKYKTTRLQYNLSMFGKFQTYNFLCAYEVLRDLNIPEASIIYAAEHTALPCRLQIVATNPVTIFDITHNLDGAKNLYEALVDSYSPTDVVIVTAILCDKDIAGMLKYFSLLATTIIFTTIKNNPRAIPANDLALQAKNMFLQNYVIDDTTEALKLAKSLDKKMVIMTGSAYLFKDLTL